MLDFLHRYGLLHLLLNTIYVGFGMVVALLLAWKLRLERRFVVRTPFLYRLLLLAVAFAGLLTLLAPGSDRFAAAAVVGLLVGFGAAYLSRAQAKARVDRGGSSSRTG